MIRARDLTKTFGRLTAVDGISFDVEEGEIFAFLGPNGAGKTTTIKMLTTLLTPTRGRVEIDGLDPTVERNEVRKRFGIVFQDPALRAPGSTAQGCTVTRRRLISPQMDWPACLQACRLRHLPHLHHLRRPGYLPSLRRLPCHLRFPSLLRLP